MMQLADLRDEDAAYLYEAQDNQEITALAYYGLLLFGNRKEVAAIIGKAHNGRGWYWNRRVACLDLEKSAHRAIQGIPELIQRQLVAFSFNYVEESISSLVMYLAETNYEDTVKGGIGIPFRRHKRYKKDATPTPKAARILYSPVAIKRFVDHGDEATLHRRSLYACWREYPWPDSLLESPDMTTIIDSLHEDVSRRRIAGERARFVTLFGSAPKPAIVSKPDRRMLKLSTNGAISVLGRETVHAFIRGESVVVPGEQLNFVLQKSVSLIRKGHDSIKVVIQDKGGTYLAKSCCYFADIPALDQLTGFALHVQSGEEQQILTTGNLFAVSQAGSKNEIISQMIPNESEEEISEYEVWRRQLRNYVEETGPIYVEAVGAALFGRSFGRVKSIIYGA